jgi:methionyl-tRNA synthetase
MAAGWPLPKKVFAHGWLLFENDKMSKSRGNIVRPTPIADAMGVDALRYFLLREIVFGSDGSFSFDALVNRYNSDLANGLGNLAARTLNMIQQYRGGVVPEAPQCETILERSRDIIISTQEAYDRFEFSKALELIWSFIGVLDKFIVERAPWKLAKDETKAALLDETLSTIFESLRQVCTLVYPVLPHTSQQIWEQLGMEKPLDQLIWNEVTVSKKIAGMAPVFPRLDVKNTVEKMQELEVAEKARQAELLGKPAEVETPKVPITPIAPAISIDDFVKVDLRVGVVKSAEPVKGADKLLHLKIDIGEAEPRTIVAGIALVYKPETLVGRKVVIVANLEPRKLRGITSQGMIVAASLEGGAPVLAGFLEDVPAGARLK